MGHYEVIGGENGDVLITPSPGVVRPRPVVIGLEPPGIPLTHSPIPDVPVGIDLRSVKDVVRASRCMTLSSRMKLPCRIDPSGSEASTVTSTRSPMVRRAPAEGDVMITSGGMFDTTPPMVQNTDPVGSDGTITLTFSDCNSGLVEYDITSIDQQGSVPSSVSPMTTSLSARPC